MSVTIKTVPHGSAAYETLVALRQKVLRTPLGLTFTPEELAKEKNATHFGLYENGNLAGTILALPLNTTTMRLRQMAVDEKFQGKGYGTRLLEHAQDFARQQDCTATAVHARESAFGFYEKNGYEPVGDPFTEVTLPHRKMVRSFPRP